MKQKKVIIVGATGLVGYAAMKYFGGINDCSVIAVSRRRPAETFGADFISVDLTNEKQCSEVFGRMTDITHVVYTALYEKPNLVEGWVDEDHILTNKLMLRNLFEPLESASKELKHVTLMQGAKAYGVHVKNIKNPAREDKSEMYEQPNFYWNQENYVKEKQKGKGWNFTIFRPSIIIGESLGSAMNIIPVIGAYAALLKEEGKPLYFPGGVETFIPATDADLLAKAIAWAGESNKAQGEAFNITNGDIFVWSTVWPTIAETLGMEVGENRPLSLKEEIPKRENDWQHIRKKYNLLAPNLKEFVGYSCEYADWFMSYGATEITYPFFLSDIKLRKAGFYDCIDSELMFKKWFKVFQEKRLIPQP